MAGAMVFAQQAFGDAMKDAMATVDAMNRAAEPVGAEFFTGKTTEASSGEAAA
jgi:hypothetical protein